MSKKALLIYCISFWASCSLANNTRNKNQPKTETIFISSQEEAESFMIRLEENKDNVQTDETVEWLTNIFNEDGNLNRSFSSWYSAVNSGFSLVYQYVVNFWNAGLQHFYDPTNTINPLAQQIGTFCSETTNTVLEPFLDEILGSIVGHVATTNVANVVDSGVTGVVDLAMDNLSDYLSSQGNKNDSNDFNFVFKKLDTILREENNFLEQSATSLFYTIQDGKLILKLQKIFTDDKNITPSVVIEKDVIQLTLTTELTDHNLYVLVSYSIVKPESLDLDTKKVSMTKNKLEEKTEINIPIISEKHVIDNDYPTDGTAKKANIFYCGISILKKEA